MLAKHIESNPAGQWQMPSGVAVPWWVIGKVGRAKLRQLGSEIQVTSDMGRPYHCVVNRRASWTMEDVFAWLEVHCCFTGRHGDIMDPRVGT